MILATGRNEYEDWLQRSRNFATRYVVTGYGLVSARLSGLCEYSDRTSGYVFVFLVRLCCYVLFKNLGLTLAFSLNPLSFTLALNGVL